jgi:tetratricopeptide (TPR) repeat protein
MRQAARGVVEAGWLVSLAAVPTVVNPYSRQAFEPDKTALFSVLVAAMGLVWLCALLPGRERGPAHRPEAPYRRAVLWAGWVGSSVAISSFLSIDPGRSWAGSYLRRQGALTELLLLLFFLLVARHLQERRQWLRAAAVMVVTSVPICVYTLFQRLGFDPVPWSYSLRVGATAGNPVFLGAYLALLPPVSVVLVVEQLRRPERDRWGTLRTGFLLYALALQVAALLLTESRGPILALAIGLLFMALAATRLVDATHPGRRRLLKRMRRAVVVCALIAAGTLAWLATHGGTAREAPVIGRLATALDLEAKTTTVRRQIWQGAAERWIEGQPPVWALRPLVGYGPETFPLAFLQVAPAEWTQPESENRLPDRAHNEIWELAITRGLFGLVSWLAFLGFLAVVGLRDLGLLPDRARVTAFGAWCLGGGATGAALALGLDRPEFLGPGIGCGLAAGCIGFVAFVPQPLDAGSTLPTWRRLAALALVTICLVHWVEIQVGFGLTITRVLFFAAAGALVGLRRRESPGEERPRLPGGRREALALGLALAAALACLGFALSSSSVGRRSPAMLLLGGLVSDGAEPLVTAFLSALVAALAVSWALLVRPREAKSSWRAGLLMAGAATLPALGALSLIHRLAFGAPGLPTPASAAASGVTGFRLLVLAVSILLVALAAVLAEPTSRPRPRSVVLAGWLAVTLLVAAAAGLSDRLVMRRIAADTHAKHGLTWLQVGRVDIGHELLDEASRLAPDEMDIWLERGRRDLELAAARPPRDGALADAVRSFERATRLAPLDADGWANLGLAQLLSGTRGRRDESLLAAADRCYRRALELRPRWPALLVQHASLATIRGDDALAQSQLARARALAAGQDAGNRAEPLLP